MVNQTLTVLRTVVFLSPRILEQAQIRWYKKTLSNFVGKGLLSGWQDSNLRPPAPKAGGSALCSFAILCLNIANQRISSFVLV